MERQREFVLNELSTVGCEKEKSIDWGAFTILQNCYFIGLKSISLEKGELFRSPKFHEGTNSVIKAPCFASRKHRLFWENNEATGARFLSRVTQQGSLPSVIKTEESQEDQELKLEAKQNDYTPCSTPVRLRKLTGVPAPKHFPFGEKTISPEV